MGVFFFFKNLQATQKWWKESGKTSRQNEPSEQRCVGWETWQMDKEQETDPVCEKTAEGNLARKSGTSCEGQGFPNHFRLRHMWNNDHICSTNQGKWTRLSPSVLVCSGYNNKIVVYLLSHWLFATPQTVARQAPLPMSVCCHALLQGIFRTQGSNPGLLHCRQILFHWAIWEAPQ